MGKAYDYSADFDKETEKQFREAVFLGEGNHGIVFELPGNKVVKIFREVRVCKREGETLRKARKSHYFPKMYTMGELYIVREKVHGERLDKYIKENGYCFQLGANIYKLFEEFRNLKFRKIDSRCKDIYVDDKKNVRLIDPKNYYTKERDYPRHLMKGLDKIGAVDDFLDSIIHVDREVGLYWKHKYEQYKKLGLRCEEDDEY